MKSVIIDYIINHPGLIVTGSGFVLSELLAIVKGLKPNSVTELLSIIIKQLLDKIKGSS